MNGKTVGQRAEAAILLEASTIKLGNVHPRASFADMAFDDFVQSASVIGAAIDHCIASHRTSIGAIAYEATSAMMECVSKNTCLGTILLLAPLVGCDNRPQVRERLLSLTQRDAELVYRSIRVANPGGIGTSETHDVHGSPPGSLLEAMQFASSYDDVALQYVTDFELVFHYRDWYTSRFDTLKTVPGQGVARVEGPSDVQQLQLKIMSERIDSLIARKGGSLLAEQVRNKAQHVEKLWSSQQSSWRMEWDSLDVWLRQQVSEQGKRIANPGTTADLIAAILFMTEF